MNRAQSQAVPATVDLRGRSAERAKCCRGPPDRRNGCAGGECDGAAEAVRAVPL